MKARKPMPHLTDEQVREAKARFDEREKKRRATLTERKIDAAALALDALLACDGAKDWEGVHAGSSLREDILRAQEGIMALRHLLEDK